VRVFGISRDSPYSHRAYAATQSLTFPLLSDWSGDAVRAFDVVQELSGMAGVPVRSCFAVDAGGVVRFARRYEDDQVPDIDELLAACTGL
jgi:peroxiredoxin